MNQPQPTASTPARAPNQGRRYLFMLLLGLVIGAVASAYLMRMWLGQPDRYYYATMFIMQTKAGQLRDAVQANRCSASDAVPHLQTLRALSNDLEFAFPDDADDARFVQHAGTMRATLDAALARPPQACDALTAVNKEIGESCTACHRDFRG